MRCGPPAPPLLCARPFYFWRLFRVFCFLKYRTACECDDEQVPNQPRLNPNPGLILNMPRSTDPDAVASVFFLIGFHIRLVKDTRFGRSGGVD